MFGWEFQSHESPYDAFVAFMNPLTDLDRRCDVQPARAAAPAGEMTVVV